MSARWMRARIAIACTAWIATGCFSWMPSRGGGQIKEVDGRRYAADDVAVPDGYVVELVAHGLTFPASVTFDAQGRPVVLEAGYSYGEVFLPPKLLRIEADGSSTQIAQGEAGLWTGVVFHDGAFYVADGGVLRPGRILRVSGDGKIDVLVDGLPSLGDHHTNGPAISPDGDVYFSVGTATNSAIVGTDNFEYGWLARDPSFHDVPCKDVQLTGRSFVTENPLTTDPNDQAETGAYQRFGSKGTPNEIIKGRVPCTGAVMKVARAGGAPELVAWGFRNPFGLAFSPEGALFVTENGYDERGSRPVFGAADVLWRVEPGRWYGWPDYEAGRRVDGEWHKPEKGDRVQLLIASDFGPVPEPAARFAVHSSSNGFDFSRSDTFGHRGHAFVAQFGDMAPKVGKVMNPVGFRVVRVEPDTGVSHVFATNRKNNGPASKLGTGGLERPTAARFDLSGEALYVVDFGIVKMTEKSIEPQPKTGALWRIRKEGGR